MIYTFQRLKIYMRDRYFIAVTLLTALILSATAALGSTIVLGGGIWGKSEQNLFTAPDGHTLLYLLAAFILCILICLVLKLANDTYARSKETGDSFSGKASTSLPIRTLILISIILAAAWLPYYLACFPGGIYADTFTSIAQALDMDENGLLALNNHHPVLYALMWRFMLIISRCLGHDIVMAAYLFYTFQYILMAVSLAFTIAWMLRRGFSRRLAYIVTFFVAFFPLYPMWTVSVWKDTFFGLALLYMSMALIDMADHIDLLRDRRYLTRLSIISLLVSFTRNNGKYIVIAVFLTITISTIGVHIRSLCHYRDMLVAFAICLAIIGVIQGPVYNYFNYNADKATESLSIPIQQMCYLVANDYELTSDELDYISTIVPVDSVNDYYAPLLYDSIKWYAPDFNIAAISYDYMKFASVYLKLLAKHPIGCLQAFALQTCGFWSPDIAIVTNGDIALKMWVEDMGLKPIDILYSLTGFDLKAHISSLCVVRSGVFLYIILFVLYILIVNRDFRRVYALLPALLCWGTIMLATPIAASFRYVNILLLMLPIDVMLVLDSRSKENT